MVAGKWLFTILAETTLTSKGGAGRDVWKSSGERQLLVAHPRLCGIRTLRDPADRNSSVVPGAVEAARWRIGNDHPGYTKLRF